MSVPGSRLFQPYGFLFKADRHGTKMRTAAGARNTQAGVEGKPGSVVGTNDRVLRTKKELIGRPVEWAAMVRADIHECMYPLCVPEQHDVFVFRTPAQADLLALGADVRDAAKVVRH